jgi:protein-L-isoaspartate(D-aspartate) O-methyltransferase
MVDTQIVPSDVEDQRIVDAMRAVPRHLFVPEHSQHLAYGDHPVPVGHGQTISQPYIVAYMTQLARLRPGHKVLDVGTGSGYQAAILAELGMEVYSIEIIAVLAERAAEALKRAGYPGVHTRVGDGYHGWPEEAPFDAIILAASPDRVPGPLKRQLAVGGRLVLPVGHNWHQDLMVVERTAPDRWEEHICLPVLFVPMTGKGIDGA